MIKFITVYVLLIAMCYTANAGVIASSLQNQAPEQRKSSNRIPKALVRFAAYSSINVAIIGASSAEGAVANPSFVKQLESYIKAFNAASRMLNISKAGWTTENHLANGTVNTVLKFSPDIVFVELGVNDYNKLSLVHYSANMQTMIKALQKSGTRVVLIKSQGIYDKFSSFTPSSYDPTTIGTTCKPKGYCIPVYWWGELTRLADKYDLDVINLWEVFNRQFELKGFTGSGLMHDSLHGNQAGHDLMYQILKRYMNRGIPKTVKGET